MNVKSGRLTTCGVEVDGQSVRLGLQDTAGQAVTLHLSFEQAGALVMTLPELLSAALRAQGGDMSQRFVFPLGGWQVEAAEIVAACS